MRPYMYCHSTALWHHRLQIKIDGETSWSSSLLALQIIHVSITVDCQWKTFSIINKSTESKLRKSQPLFHSVYLPLSRWVNPSTLERDFFASSLPPCPFHSHTHKNQWESKGIVKVTRLNKVKQIRERMKGMCVEREGDENVCNYQGNQKAVIR